MSDKSDSLARFILRDSTGNVRAFGTRLPSGTAVLEWNLTAWPEDERLSEDHQSTYGCIEDVQQVADGGVEWIDAPETKYGSIDA